MNGSENGNNDRKIVSPDGRETENGVKTKVSKEPETDTLTNTSQGKGYCWQAQDHEDIIGLLAQNLEELQAIQRGIEKLVMLGSHCSC